jgi:hypothetical protein
VGADGLTMGRESPIACDLTALDPAQRERRRVLGAQLAAVAELPDGYAFRSPADSSTCLAVAEFVTLERRCAPFFDFVLEVEREGDPCGFTSLGAAA